MKVSLQWLREFIDLPTEDPAALTEAFSSLGMQVEEVLALKVPFRGVVVARVEAVLNHPEADRLRVCSVSAGDRVYEVVCGAWNFGAGAMVPLALPGATLADGSEVGVRTIRGIASHGMICSPLELALGPDAEGILVLDGAFEVGDDLSTRLPFPDLVFDLEIESNRPDEMSMVGVARELGAYFGLSHRPPRAVVDRPGPQVAVEVTIEDPHGCGRFVAIPVDEVRIGPAPLEIQLRLQAAGIRPIGNVVDVTNYVMLEVGQPLHAFDLDRIEGGHLVVRRARGGEKLITLDGVERTLTPEDLVIADGAGVTSLAGVMGGERSEVRPETVRVLLEAAHWDPPTISGASMRHGLRSEASSRFSRGVDPNLPPVAARRAAQLLQSWGVGRVSSTEVDQLAEPSEPWVVELPLRELERLLGVAVPGPQAAELLTRLGMGVEGTDPLVVTVPTSRQDVTRAADLVEEVARLYGYDKFPESVPRGTGGGLPVQQVNTRRVRQVMAGSGFTETQTLSFMSASDLVRLRIPAGDPRGDVVVLKNPVSAAQGLLRTTFLPGLLEAAGRNVAGGHNDVALFEIGRVFTSPPSPDDARIPTQPRMLAFVALGHLGPRSLQHPGVPVDFHAATAVWRVLAEAMGLHEASIRDRQIPGLHPSRSAEVALSGEVIGYVGELHPSATRDFGLQGRVAVGEVRLGPLIADRGPRQFRAPSPFPAIMFDLAFEIEVDVPAGELLQVVRAAGGLVLESTEIFDEFRGEGVAPEHKSLAVRIVLRGHDRTLTGEDEKAVRDAIIRAVAADLGGKLRGEP